MAVTSLRARSGVVALATLLGVVAPAGLVAGCHRSSRGFTGNSDADQGLVAHAAVVVADAAGTLALAAGLARMDTGYTPVVPSPSASTSGSATNGQVTLDFGSPTSSGTDVDAATLTGQVQATYVRSGADATITVSFPSLVATTHQFGTATVSGALTLTVTFGPASATGTLTGVVTLTNGAESATVTPNVTYSFSSGTTGAVTLNGTLGYTSSARGSWTVALGNLALQANPPPRSITGGTVTLTRTTGSAIAVALVFTAPNQGTLTVTPGPTTTTFRL